MTIIKAQVAIVPVGLVEIIGLMDDNKKFYVGVPQMVDLKLVPPNRSISWKFGTLSNSAFLNAFQ